MSLQGAVLNVKEISFRTWGHTCSLSNVICIIHYCDVIMGTMGSQITNLTIVYSTVYSDADQRKLQNSASLAFGRGLHRGPVNSPHKWPITRKMFPFDDVTMEPGDLLTVIPIGPGVKFIMWTAGFLAASLSTRPIGGWTGRKSTAKSTNHRNASFG